MLDILLKIFLPVLIFIIIITVINIIYRSIKYGERLLPPLKFKKNINYQNDIIKSRIEQISGYRKVIQLVNYNSNLLIVDERGLYLVHYCNQAGTLIGETNNDSLTLKKSNYSFTTVPNPFKMILDDEIKLLKIISDYKIKKYIIFNNNSNIQVQAPKNVETTFLRNFELIFNKELKNQNVQNKEVDELYNKLKNNS